MTSFSEAKKEVAERAGRETDPNEKHQWEMDDGNDWFQLYYDDFVEKADIKDSYRAHYRRAFDDWKEHMAQYDRHSTLPNHDHVEDFVDAKLEEMKGSTVQDKLNLIKEAYEHMQNDEALPHPTNYNPFTKIKRKRRRDLREQDPDDFPELDLEDVSRVVRSIKHVGERAVTVLALKTGIRVTELENIEFRDLHLTNPDVLTHYDSVGIGTHSQLNGHTDALYIPPEDERNGNKRVMPTVIPLDDETRRVLIDWLLIRPDNGSESVFLTQKGGTMKKSSQEHVWRKHWHPEYEFGKEEAVRSITPHYARHWMSSWFRVKRPIEESHILYLRGDKQGPDIKRTRSAFHRYVHAYYDDVEQEYREQIFKLGI